MALSITSQVEANKTKTWLIMAFFAVFISMVAYVLGKASGFGISWAGIALLVSGIFSLGSYFWGDKLILTMSGAHPADRNREPDLFAVVEHVSLLAKIPKPKVYVMEEESPNAFATGRDPDHASICATRGILNMLTRTELEAVIAHEMSHIQNYDTRILAIITMLVGMVAFLSNWFMQMLWWGGGRRRNNEESGNLGAVFMILGVILAMLSPIIATLIQLAVSRRREFLADASGALLTHNPDALAAALEKISSSRIPMRAASNATAHLFIVNPFKGKDAGIWFANLFNTHPPAEERIKILRSM